MFNVSALLLDDALKPATPMTNGAINEMLRHTLEQTIGQCIPDCWSGYRKKHGSQRCRVELVELTVDDVWQQQLQLLLQIFS